MKNNVLNPNDHSASWGNQFVSSLLWQVSNYWTNTPFPFKSCWSLVNFLCKHFFFLFKISQNSFFLSIFIYNWSMLFYWSIPHHAMLILLIFVWQVSYMILQMVSPVTHAVGNCVKRVLVIVSSVFFFQTPASPINSLGKFFEVIYWW